MKLRGIFFGTLRHVELPRTTPSIWLGSFASMDTVFDRVSLPLETAWMKL